MAYASAAALLMTVHALTWLAFRQGRVPVHNAAGGRLAGDGGHGIVQYFVTRRQLDKAGADRSRYQQAIHFVAHEMR